MLFATNIANANKQENTVVIVELSGEIDQGQTALIDRGLNLAQKINAKAFILQIDTFGGLVASATSIRDKLLQTNIETICYVKNRAWSAGALIAISCDKIIMAPGSSIGAAEPIPTTEKTIAAVKAEFASTAEKKGKDPLVAQAMVDKTLGYKNYAQKGQILALTAQQAVEVGYAQFICPDRQELLQKLGLENSKQEIINKTWQENAIGILESQAVKSALLSIIILAIFTEVKTGGTGFGAAVAIVCGMLLYGTSFLGGIGSWLEPALFILGLVLLGAEMFIPGFGIFGIGGIISIFVSFFLVLGGNQNAFFWLAMSLVVSIVLFFLVIKKLTPGLFGSRFILKNTESRQEGFSSNPDYEEYIDKIGMTTTQLKPGGTADFDGMKLDVLTYGEFVQPNKKVQVVKVEGNKLFVKTID